MTDWIEHLKAAVAAHPRGQAGVANDLGYSRSAICSAIAGNYPGNTDRIARAVLDRYDQPDCPLVGRAIERTVCRRTALIPMPAGGEARRRWDACQRCAQRPADRQNKEDQNHD